MENLMSFIVEIREHWDENGKLKHKEYWLYGNQVSKEEYEKLSKK